MGTMQPKPPNDSLPGYPHASSCDRVEVSAPCPEWFRQLPIFLHLTLHECKEIVAAARQKAIRRRHVIYSEGSSYRQVLLVLSGCIKTTQVGSKGSQVILHLAAPGELVGTVGSHHLMTATATTTQPTTALVWDAKVFETLLRRNQNLRLNTDRYLCHRLQELEVRLREIYTKRVPSRLSQALIRLSRLHQSDLGALRISLSREELAQFTGMTFFTVSRLLAKWDRLGIVDARREAIVVCDLKALTEISESG